MEGVFSRGDRKLGSVLHKAFELGAKFDGWTEFFRFETWMRAFEECGIEPDYYLKERKYSEPFAWDHISSGIAKEALIKESIAAHKEADVKLCNH